ncbi:MAG: hypothetical protein LUE16_08700 [Lachnospiraceae bacterium]|nr:hypothetical protein [Lachnospiraceae bacterium]
MEINNWVAKGIDMTDEAVKGRSKKAAERMRDRRTSDFRWKSCEREWNIMNAFLKVLGGRKIKARNINTARILEYAEELAPCYEMWISWREKRQAFERSEQVLRMYYQKDRILDYLLKIEDFAGTIRPTDNPELLAVKGALPKKLVFYE